MNSLIQTIISNVLKYMVPSYISENHIYNRLYNNVMKSISLLLVLSILLSSTILLICLGLAHYLWEMHFTFYQLLGVIIAIKSFLLLFCILCFKSTIQKIRDLNSNSNHEKEKLYNYNLVGSFIDGFNEKK